MRWFIFALVVARATTTSHDFAACVTYLESFAEETTLFRPISEVPKHLRRHFDGTAKLVLVGSNPSRADEVFFVTAGDFTRDAGVGPTHLRLARVGEDVRRAIEANDWGRPLTLVARRHSPLHVVGSQLTDEDVRGLKSGAVLERFGIYYVLSRSLNARPPAWQYEAYRFNRMPRADDRANQLVTLIPGEFTWIGEAVIGRHANVIVIDAVGLPRTRLFVVR